MRSTAIILSLLAATDISISDVKFVIVALAIILAFVIWVRAAIESNRYPYEDNRKPPKSTRRRR